MATKQEIIDRLSQCGGLSYQDWINLLDSIFFDGDLGETIVSIPSTNILPASNVAYKQYTFATSGTYTQSGGSPIVVPANTLAILEKAKNGGIWTIYKTVPLISGVENINPLGSNIPTESAVAKYAPSKSFLGIESVKENENVILNFTNGSTTDASLFNNDHFYHKGDGSVQLGTEFACSVNKNPIVGGIDYDYKFFLYGNAGVVFFDRNNVKVVSISTTNSTVTELTGTISLPESVVSYGLSHYKARPLTSIYLRAKSSKETVKTTVFTTPSYVDDELNNNKNEIFEEIGFSEIENKFKDKPFVSYDTFEKFGFKVISAGENIFDFLQPVDVNNTEIWGSGYLRISGVITPDSVWIHTKDFYELPTGTYQTNMVYAGNAGLWVVDKNGNMLRALQGGNSSGTLIWNFTINNAIGEYGIKIGVSKTVVSLGWTMFIRSTEDIYIQKNSSSEEPQDDTTAKELLKNVINIKYPIKRTPPVITFISDDGARENAWFIEALDLYNWKATFAIITGRFPDTTSSLQAFYNKEDIVNLLLNKGHEIAGHTVSHNASAQLATLTVDQLHQEIGKCKLDLLSVDNRIEADSFISPFGSRNLNVDLVVRQYFKANYVTRADSDIATGVAINQPPIDNYFMKRVSFDVNSPTSGAMDISRIDIARQAVDKVVELGGWLIFAIHPHYEQYLNPANTVDSKQELRDLLAYINSLNIPVMTANQARKHYENYSIGNYRLDTSYYERGINGTESGILLD